MKKAISGFTIVELLIVIVVIAILAAISIVAYNGISQRARDSARTSDMKSIQAALELYKADNGRYPNATSANGSWEESHLDGSGSFMEYLVSGKYVRSVPLDPVNSSGMRYRYYKYPAEDYGCPASRGAYYVLGIIDMESSARPASSSPGWSCPSRNWETEFDWVTGGFEQ